MSEAKQIKNSPYPMTRVSLRRDLKRLGVRAGDVLLVHSAFGKLGWVVGGPQALIEALSDAVGEAGTIVMTAQTGLSDPAEWANPPIPKAWVNETRRALPAFEPDKTPTRGQGVVPEYFRTFPGVKRSSHPEISFCALGARARSLTTGHTLDADFGEKSPLGKMVRANAKVLMLGTDYFSCTALHLAEHLSATAPLVRHGLPLMVDGKRKWVWYKGLDHDSSDFDAIGRAFERKHKDAFIKGKVGLAKSRLIDMTALTQFASGWMERNRESS
jgi:aminoglycoside 3-N-acetyltransferase